MSLSVYFGGLRIRQPAWHPTQQSHAPGAGEIRWMLAGINAPTAARGSRSTQQSCTDATVRPVMAEFMSLDPQKRAPFGREFQSGGYLLHAQRSSRRLTFTSRVILAIAILI